MLDQTDITHQAEQKDAVQNDTEHRGDELPSNKPGARSPGFSLYLLFANTTKLRTKYEAPRSLKP